MSLNDIAVQEIEKDIDEIQSYLGVIKGSRTYTTDSEIGKTLLSIESKLSEVKIRIKNVMGHCLRSR